MTHAIRWCVGCVLGLLAGYPSLNLVAAFVYALPRAVLNAARGFASWSVSRFYLIGAVAYAGLLLVVVVIAYWFAVDPGALLFGALLRIIPMLATLKNLKGDVDERLGKANG